tara:strand:+ start:548 stop:1105 length:558 start_codon:yes stop_codon:yes gene_type:complete
MSKILVDTIDTRSGTSTLTVGSSNSSAISLAKNVSLASGVVQSNLNNPAFLAYLSGAASGGSVSNLTATLVVLDTEIFDSDGKFDTSNGRFTPGIAGKYFFYASARFQSDADFDPFEVAIYKNGSSELARFQDRHEHYSTGVTSVVADLNTTDYINLRVYQGSGGTLQLSGYQNVTFMGGFRIGT